MIYDTIALWIGRVILAGEKTQTRRPIKHRHEWAIEERDGKPWPWHPPYVYAEDDAWMNCPYGVPGDRLWVRETWCSGNGLAHVESPERLTAPAGAAAAPRIIYAADGATLPPGCPWRPSIHMPRWASRLTLEVVSVRVERISEISDADVLAEGVRFMTVNEDKWATASCRTAEERGEDRPLFATKAGRFRAGWDSLYAKTPNAWAANPWVWVVEFRRVEENR